MEKLLRDADAFEGGALFVEWLGALYTADGKTQEAEDCAVKAADLRALAGMYRTAADTADEDDDD